jgi:HK97 family phage major capsid protein
VAYVSPRTLRAFGDSFKAYREGLRKPTVEKSQQLTSLIGATGGYLIPAEYMIGIDQKLMEDCIFLQRGFRQEMTSREMHIAGVDLSVPHTAGTSPLLGGLQMSWSPGPLASGTPNIPTVNPSFFDVHLIANELSGDIVVSNQLLEDGGIALGSYLHNVITRALAWYIEHAGYRGTGLGQPLGVTAASGTLVVARQTTVTVTTQDIAGLEASLYPACSRNAVWVCSPTALKAISQLTTYIINQLIKPGDGLVGFLFNRPLYVSEHLPKVGTQGDVVVFDPTLYIVGIREVEIAVSDQVNFQQNQTVFRVVLRADMQPYVRGLFQNADNDGNLMACYVVLSTK